MMSDYDLENGILKLKPGCEIISTQEFAEREDIVKVIIPEGVKLMEDECFVACPNLEEAVLPEGLVNVGPAAFGECSSLKKVSLPSTLKSIDGGAFLFCTELKEIEFPDGLELIDELAFQGSGLITVRIPESVKRIEESAFFSCEALKRADVLGRETILGKDCFGCNDKLNEGFIAPGFPEMPDAAAELLYTLLWCTCQERHDEATSGRAADYIRANSQLIIERIVKTNNVPALAGLLGSGLLPYECIEAGLEASLNNRQTELSALFLKLKQNLKPDEEEFEL